MQPTKFVSYCRVSTDKQGASGLSLEAQQATVRQYAEHEQGVIIQEFTEVESGAHPDRPQLAAALNHCKLTGACLLVAKLDRLSRDLHFVTNLEKAGIAFIVCDFPNANTFTIHIFAALAQYERELISARTAAALGALKARGKKLGTPGNLTTAAAARGRAAGAEARRRVSQQHAAQVGPTLQWCAEQGMTLTQTAEYLTARHILTPGGGIAWTATTVRRALQAATI